VVTSKQSALTQRLKGAKSDSRTTKKIVKREIELYVGYSFTSQSYSLIDNEQQHYAVVSLPNLPRPYPSRVVVMARIVENKVLIEEDITDKPFVNALMQNGNIPREQIVLAYSGESIDDE
jgi:hypothetical protein